MCEETKPTDESVAGQEGEPSSSCNALLSDKVGPIYGVLLLDSLPLSPSASMLQALPSRDDLQSVLDAGCVHRIVAGYEVLLGHYQRLLHVSEAQEELIAWYEDDHDRTQYDEDDLPEELVGREAVLRAAKGG